MLYNVLVNICHVALWRIKITISKANGVYERNRSYIILHKRESLANYIKI